MLATLINTRPRTLFKVKPKTPSYTLRESQTNGLFETPAGTLAEAENETPGNTVGHVYVKAQEEVEAETFSVTLDDLKCKKMSTRWLPPYYRPKITRFGETLGDVQAETVVGTLAERLD